MLKLIVLNEVHSVLEGFGSDIRYIIYEKMKKRVNGYQHTSAYKLGRWDGYNCHFDPYSGAFYNFLTDDIIEIVCNNMSAGEVESIEFIDNRGLHDDSDVCIVDKDHLLETGLELYYYQIDAINEALNQKKGVLELCTSSGKTMICGGIIKALEHKYKSVTIVTSNKLVKQTYELYKSLNIKNVEKIDYSVKDKTLEGRKEIIDNAHHLVITWQTLNNIKVLFEGFDGVVLHDEVHNFSNVAIDLWNNIFYDVFYRIGLTGTLPANNPWKNETIFCCLGGSVIKHIGDYELRQQGYISQAEIEMVQVFHESAEEEVKELTKAKYWDYEAEKNYLNKNEARLKGIIEFIRLLPPKNTLILGQASLIKRLSEQMDLDYITQKTTHDDRDRLFNGFSNSTSYILPASYGTSSTGISVNEIFRLIIIDPGKSNILVNQSIGRSLRLDGVYDNVDIIDIYSNMPFSKKHAKERKRLYKNKAMNFIEGQKIVI